MLKGINDIIEIGERAIDAMADNERVLIEIWGEGGTGKTTFLQKIMHLAEKKEVHSFYGRCIYSHPPIPYLPLSMSINSYLRKIGNDITSFPESIYLVADEEDVVYHSIAQKPERFMENTVEFMEEISGGGPLFIVVDDFQFIDKATMNFLMYISCREREPMSICLSYRGSPYDPPEIEEYVENMRKKGFFYTSKRIKFRTLQRDDAHSLMCDIYPEVDEIVCAKISHQLGYNPLLIKCAGHLMKNGVDVNEISEIALGGDPQFFLRKYIDYLDDESKKIAKTSYIVSLPFTMRMLEEIYLNKSNLKDIVDNLIEREVLWEKDEHEKMYFIGSLMINEAISDIIFGEELRTMSWQVGSTAEKLMLETGEISIFQLANYFSKSADIVRAIDYLSRAAEEACKMHAFEEALLYFEESLANIEWTEDSEEKRELQHKFFEKISMVHISLGNPNAALDYLNQHKKIAEEKKDKKMMAIDEICMADCYRRIGELPLALQHSNIGMQLAKDCDGKYQEAFANLMKGMIYFDMGAYHKTMMYFRDAREILGEGDVDSRFKYYIREITERISILKMSKEIEEIRKIFEVF